MTLQFTCPSGHVISCEDSFSGKPAKCPQCSAKFVVPPPGQKTADPLPTKKKGTGGDAKSKSANKPKEDMIDFLCPNGHKLNGPARLQGKPGQCPECDAKFRIPSYEDADEEQDEGEEEEEILTGEEVGEDEVFDALDMEEIEIVDDVEYAEFEAAPGEYDYADAPIEDVPVTDFVPALPEFVEGAHALSSIFGLLWQQRQFGGAIEMQLAEGELLTPDYFSPELSQSTHGVFAIRGKDGTYTITTVPWDKVLRVSLRKTDDLPPGLFEE